MPARSAVLVGGAQGDTSWVEAIVGRAAEQAQLRAALAAAQDGRGSLLLVGGAAGIGKTRLAVAAVKAAQSRGMRVARGYAVDDPGAPALWPWLRVMRDWPEVAALPTGDARDSDAAARFQFFVAVTDLIVSRANPAGLLVVLEDFHWADRLSVLLLRHTVAELAEHPVAIVVTYRDAVPGPLSDTMLDLLRADATRAIPLAGLDVDAVAAWLPQLTDYATPKLAAALHSRTGGNPLLIRLVAENLTGGGQPGSLDGVMSERPQLRRLVAAKVDLLAPEARATIEAASVVGERLSSQLLAVMTARAETVIRSHLADATAAGVLTQTADGVVFEHALVRDAVYARLGAAERGMLHRQAAQALNAASAPAGPIAMHWRRAAGADVVRLCQEWSERADEQARAARAHDDASRFATLAVDCARERVVDGAELARLLIRQAEADALCARTDACVAACMEAADLAEACGRADLLAASGLVAHGVGDARALVVISGICERALARVEKSDHATRARLLAQISVTMSETEGGTRCADVAADALAEADASGDDVAILEAMAARHLSITVPDTVAERLELGRRAVELGASSSRPIATLWGHLWRADAALQLGNLAEVQREVDEIDRIARTRGSVLARWHHHRYVASCEALTGNFAQAREANLAARTLGERVGDLSMWGQSFAFSHQLSILRGDLGEMPPEWEEMIDHAPAMPLIKISKPIQHALAGDLDRARAEFEQFRSLPETFPFGVRWAGTIAQVGSAAILLDDAAVADAVYRAFVRWAHSYSGDGSGGSFSFGSTSRFLGDLALVTGRPDVAARHQLDAVAMNARIGARPYTALSRLSWARALDALGLVADPHDGTPAVQLVDLASAEFERLDMPGPLATARALAHSLAGKRAAARRTTSPLSPREDEVARLVAEALSNKQIAARLYLSERTIETHVRSILTKLAFTTRTEIATWVLRSTTDA